MITFFIPPSLLELSRILLERGEKMSTAESCTGGLITGMITEISGCSDYFKGGCVLYSSEAKVDLLGIDRRLIEEHGVVSAEVAEAMASAVVRKFNTQLGISTTGWAGPQGGSPMQPIGTVWIGVYYNGFTNSHLLHFKGSRPSIRLQATQKAIDFAWQRMVKNTML